MLFLPPLCVATVVAIPHVLNIKSTGGWEGVGELFVFIESVTIFPALLLTISAFCTIFKRKIFRIGLPIISYLGLVIISTFALLAKRHAAEIWMLANLVVFLPMAILDFLMLLPLERE